MVRLLTVPLIVKIKQQMKRRQTHPQQRKMLQKMAKPKQILKRL